MNYSPCWLVLIESCLGWGVWFGRDHHRRRRTVVPLLRPQTHQVYSFSQENRFDHVRGITGFLCFRSTLLFLSLIKIPGKLLGMTMHTLFLAKIRSICWCLLASSTTAPVTESGELRCSCFIMFTACQAAIGKALHFSLYPVFCVSMD